MLEVQIEDKIVKWAKREGFLTPKVKFVEAGFPDRLFISPFGHTIFMEIKKPGEVPTPIQLHRIEQLTKRGVPAIWVDSVLEGINVLKAALEASSISGTGDPSTPIPGLGGPLPRPGIREDLRGLGNLQDFVREGLRPQDADSGAPAPSPESVAGRDKEMVRLLRPDAYNSTWGREGDKS